MLIGYARVSKLDQNPELQLDALQDAKCDKIYVDYLTGAKTDRPEWQELLAYIREGGSRKKRVRRISGMRVDLMPGIRPYTLPTPSSGGSSSWTPSQSLLHAWSTHRLVAPTCLEQPCLQRVPVLPDAIVPDPSPEGSRAF